MIVNKSGAEFTHNGKTYVIGEPIYTNDESDYRGLFGTIIEIRYGDDKETDNDTPDIYCALDEPVLLYDKQELEKRFSALYGEKKSVEDIILDFVILSPEMIVQVNSLTNNSPIIEAFTVKEKCCSQGENQVYSYIFTDYILAKQKFNELVAQDYQNGLINVWADDKDFRIESDEDSLTAWLNGNYFEEHYQIYIESESFSLSSPVFEAIGMSYIKEKLKNRFYEQTAQCDSVSNLSKEEYNALCHSDETARKILSDIESDERLQELFWHSLSETSHRIISEYLKKKEG